MYQHLALPCASDSTSLETRYVRVLFALQESLFFSNFWAYFFKLIFLVRIVRKLDRTTIKPWFTYISELNRFSEHVSNLQNSKTRMY